MGVGKWGHCCPLGLMTDGRLHRSTLLLQSFQDTIVDESNGVVADRKKPRTAINRLWTWDEDERRRRRYLDWCSIVRMTIDLASTSLANVSHKRREKLYASLLAARRQSNESAFVSVVQWWKAFLHEIVASGLLGGDDRLVLRVGDQLKEVLCWPGIGSPGSIATIIVRPVLRLSLHLIPSLPHC